MSGTSSATVTAGPGALRLVMLLFRRNVRTSALATASLLALLFAFFTLGTYLFPTLGETNRAAMGTVSPELLIAFFGGVLGGFRPVDLWLITLFAHPLLMISLAALVVGPATRDLVGEIDRGTLDLLLGCPVPRWALPAAVWLSAQAALLGLIATVWAGLWFGGWLVGPETSEGEAILATLPRYQPVLAQLWLLGQAILGLSVASSASASLYGGALARTLGILVFSYFLNLLAGLWTLLAPLRWLSIYHYYQPQPILAGRSQLFEAGVLTLVAIVGVAYGSVRFQRRDIEGV